jgi:prepilin-type N-terminal cleavage/methylation domain-containing protein
MKYMKSKIICSDGFTLVEVIVTILAAGILGAIFINFMGTALNASWNAVEITRDEAGTEALMEQIVGEYVALINGNNPANALGSIVTNYNGQTINGIRITTQYIDFDAAGNEVPSGSNDNLKVSLQSSGPGAPAITGRYSLTTILTNCRSAGDPIVFY